MYKYGIRNGSLGMGWKEGLEAAGEIGFDGVELVVREMEEVDRLLTDEGRDEVLGWVRSSGAEVCSLSVAGFRAHKDAKGDPGLREEVVEGVVKKSLQACKRVGGVGVLLPYFEREHIDSTDEEAGWLVEDMKQCAPVAEELGVMICLETSFSSGLLKRICDGVGSDAVGVYADIGNALHYGHDSVEQLTSLAKETKMIHVKDTKRSMLGGGEVDFPGSREAIREIGYEGWLVFETPGGDDPVASARQNLGFAKQAFE